MKSKMFKKNFLKCHLCSAAELSAVDLDAHLIQKHCFCSKCEQIFTSPGRTLDHLNIIHKITKTCPYCPWIIIDSKTLARHIMTKHSEKLLRCTICAKQVTNQNELEEHYFEAHKYCFTCKLEFKTMKKASEHFQKVHFEIQDDEGEMEDLPLSVEINEGNIFFTFLSIKFEFEIDISFAVRFLKYLNIFA